MARDVRERRSGATRSEVPAWRSSTSRSWRVSQRSSGTRHHYDAGAGDREPQLQQLGAVGQHRADALTGSQATLDKTAREPVGKIVEEWPEFDELGILRQLGADVGAPSPSGTE